MFDFLQQVNRKPTVFSQYTAESLWTDPYRAQQMLTYHLNKDLDISSNRAEYIEHAVAWIAQQFDLGAEKKVCDFGCGPGLWCARFAQTGARVSGIDFSANSLAYARRMAAQQDLDIEYLQQNYLDFSGDQDFDLITMIMWDFCALSPEQRAQLLGVFHRCLKRGGQVLLDVFSLTSFEEREESATCEKNQLHHFWSEDEYYAFVNIFKYGEEQVVLDKYTLVDAMNRTETVYNWLQYFTLERLRCEFEQAGFAIRSVYSDLTGAPYTGDEPTIAVIAEKVG